MVLIGLSLPSLINAQVATSGRTVSSLPPSCKGGNAEKTTDFVFLASGGTSTLNWCGSSGNWVSPTGTNPGGTSNQIQWNHNGVFAGFTMSGDCTLTASTGAITCLKSNGVSFGSNAFLSNGVQNIFSGSSALGTSPISSATCALTSVTATGLLTSDVIITTFNSDPTGTTGFIPSTSGILTVIIYPTANTINIKVCNNTSSSITPGSVTVNLKVIR
jgi:hypothetical protein